MTQRNQATPSIEEQPPDEPVVLAPLGPTDVPTVRTDAPVAPDAPKAGKGEVVLVITSGGDVFGTGRDDVSALTRTGTVVPEKLADELIDFAAANDVTVSKLES